jgi:hypothetical protein
MARTVFGAVAAVGVFGRRLYRGVCAAQLRSPQALLAPEPLSLVVVHPSDSRPGRRDRHRRNAHRGCFVA